MFSSDRPSWQNPKVLTTLILVFVSGAFAGALSMRLGLHQRLHYATAVGLQKPDNAKLFLDRCTKELNLSGEQAEQFRTILDDYKLYYQQVQDELDEVRATGKSRLMKVLNDDQRLKLDRMMTEMK